jgi:hypothetical protein
MTEDAVAKELLGGEFYCSRGLFALVNRALNRSGLLAAVTSIDDDTIEFTVKKNVHEQ